MSKKVNIIQNFFGFFFLVSVVFVLILGVVLVFLSWMKPELALDYAKDWSLPMLLTFFISWGGLELTDYAEMRRRAKEGQ